ncbi:MAG: hypothetical protein QXL96_08690 [Ignisphaera sp.]
MIQFLNFNAIKDIEMLIENKIHSRFKDIIIENKLILKGDVFKIVNTFLIDIWILLNNNLYLYDVLEGIPKQVSSLGVNLYDKIIELTHGKYVSSYYLILAGNLTRAITLLGPYGYFKMIFDAGRLTQTLIDKHNYKLVDIDLYEINNLFKFDLNKYTAIALLCAGDNYGIR